MPNEVLFKTESRQRREDIASILEENVAYHLDQGTPIPIGAEGDALVAGEEYMRPMPPAIMTFEITLEREEPPDGPRKTSLAFKLTWDETGAGDEIENEQSEREC